MLLVHFFFFFFFFLFILYVSLYFLFLMMSGIGSGLWLWQPLDFPFNFLNSKLRWKKLIEKSRECHNHKPQPTPNTKRKRKMTKTNTHKTNKQTNAREAHRQAPSSPSEVITMLKGMKKHEDKEHGNTLKYKTPRSINHKATQNKNNTGTTALERSVA